MTILRKRMIEDMQIRNKSPHTQAAYVQQVSLFSPGAAPRRRQEEFAAWPEQDCPQRRRSCAFSQVSVENYRGTTESLPKVLPPL